MKIYEVEERTPLVAPLLNIWEEIWYSKLWNQGSYRQRAESTVGFYEHLGFKTYKRTDHDEEGNPYPLLYMKLM